ncbi:bifunctional aspartokinase I/homoserine dehydrogenase I [Spirochaetia bacterium]|nr:bifunctional aspartokinase I/homoserine dehydrogenase I [Spirochaetia bacterium]
MLVLKFGGTSVGTPGAIAKILDILGDEEHSGRAAVVVVSAFSGVTDSLIAIAKKAAAGGPWTADVERLRQRHEETGAAFLSGEDLRAAAAELAETIEELRLTLVHINSLGTLTERDLDRVMSFGERFSAALLARIFRARALPACYLDTRPLIIAAGEPAAEAGAGKGRYLAPETNRRIRQFFEDKGGGGLFVATGFIAQVGEGTAPDLQSTVTLGRGGSDLTAAIFAAALGAERTEIWTDVDGILTADPKLVKNAFRIEALSYEEAMELSHFGAKVIYPPTIRPALEEGIPIQIRNTFNAASPGTLITAGAPEGDFPIRGISSMNEVALLRLEGPGMMGVAGSASRLFAALARKNINIIMITQSSSEYSICFAVMPADADSACDAMREEFRDEIAEAMIRTPVIQRNLSIIAVVGSKMKSASGISGKFFHALGRNGINVAAIAQGSGELNISAVISRQDEAKALNAVHEAFFLSGLRSVNLFLTGTGLIGGTLLEQIAGHHEILADEHKIRIKLAGAANSRYMAFSPDGLDPRTIKELLHSGGEGTEPFRLSLFIEKMKAMNLPNTAFCDCTASDEVSGRYAEIMRSFIPIVTPNKRANAASYENYQMLTGYSRDRGIPYLYETTVCAGLPVISTLRDLFLSGDTVRSIAAVLSGTLSYIFNNYDGSKSFSALVREAKARGYTEPDPRDDLNAMDAARKALILARECGIPLEFSQVEIEPLLPASCFEAADVESFFRELEKSDDYFEERRSAAAAEGKALRYLALIEGESVRLCLRAEPADSPFCSLKDSDNIVVITTDRYCNLPMVIKGPGAGAEVTAGGIFADIVRIARTLV